MANIPIWPGSSSFAPGDTPFGFYDYNPDFQRDADKVSKFCGLRLGFPIENVELQDINFYTAFEEAVTVYSNELFAYKQREDYLTLEGAPYSYENSNVNFQDAIVTPNLRTIVDLSEQYGTWAGVGGDVDWYKGNIVLTSSIQDYNLDDWASSVGLTGSDVEIMRIFYEPRPASADVFGGFMGGVMGMGALAASGMAGYGANSFLMTPLSMDLQMIQGIEMFRNVLFANYTFQLINNKLRIFPVPTDAENGDNLWFEYMLKSDEDCVAVEVDPNKISNISQVPYRNIDYDSINSVGRSWIFEYTLALSKEILGYVRGKYTSVPIPGAEVTLNQADLLTSATADKNALVDRLRAYFDDTSRQKLLERKQAESVAMQSELDRVPMTIFVG